MHNSIVDAMLAYPFFIIGYLMKGAKDYINNIKQKDLLVSILLVGIFIIIFCGYKNGEVKMYDNIYGKDILLFYIGGIGGSIAVFAIAKLLDTKKLASVLVISKGSIIILGLQWMPIKICIRFTDNNMLYSMIASFIIMLAFIPIITFIEKKLPVLIGRMSIE